MITIAKVVSILLHPALLILLMPFLVVYKQTENSIYALKWEIFSAFFVFLAGILVFFGERSGVFSDADLTKRNERYKFYLMVITLLLLYIAVVVFFKGIFSPFVIIALGTFIGVIIFTIANHLFKISIHSGVVCALVMSVGILYGLNAFFAIVWIVPLMIWARVVLKRHTIAEAISGGTLGGLITVLTYFVGRNFYKL